jgi:plasmid stability protein
VVQKKLKRPPPRGSDQFVMRFPDGMRDQIAILAAQNNRSMNAELIDRLEKSMAGTSVAVPRILVDACALQHLVDSLDRMDLRLEKLQQLQQALEKRGISKDK